jgi:hypothetical protein
LYTTAWSVPPKTTIFGIPATPYWPWLKEGVEKRVANDMEFDVANELIDEHAVVFLQSDKLFETGEFIFLIQH